jgi:hypothetical protein
MAKGKRNALVSISTVSLNLSSIKILFGNKITLDQLLLSFIKATFNKNFNQVFMS